MPQTLLPIFPTDTTLINPLIGFSKRGHTVYYFNGQMPIFSHAADDLRSFRLITAQLVVNGNATQAEIVRAFGISIISMKRYVKLYREEGAAGFFKPRSHRSGHVLTHPVLTKIQEMLEDGKEVSTVSSELSIKVDTIYKAIRDGRLRKPKKKSLV